MFQILICFYVKIVTCLSQQRPTPSESPGLVKPPLFENLVGDLTPQQKNGRGVHYGMLWILMKFCQVNVSIKKKKKNHKNSILIFQNYSHINNGTMEP